jgi:cation diffusion facilitator family transporter
MQNNSLEKKAPIVAMSVAFFLALTKFIIWIISWSVALLSSAMDSLLDTWVSIFNYFAIKFSQNPADEEHPYWHWKIEWIAATIEWTIITWSWIYIVYEAIKKILNPKAIDYIDWTLWVMFISIIATWWLVYFLNYVYKKTNNLVIKWDSIHYKMDLYTNLAVIITLVIIYFVPNLSWIDWIIGLLIWLYIIHEAWELIKDWINLLLDKALEEHNQVEKIIKSYVKNKKIQSYHCLKTRSGWSKEKFVEFHFVMDPETTILEAHEIWDEIEEKIKKLDKKADWYIVWHVDPYDDSKTNWCK